MRKGGTVPWMSEQGLDLTPKTVEEPDSSKRAGGRLRILLLVAVLAVAGIGVGWVATKYVENLLFPTVDGNRCAALAPGNCTDLSLQKVEQLSGVDLPDGSEVVNASSTSKFAARSLYALIQLPHGSTFTPPPGFESRTGGPPSTTIINMFEGVGVTRASSGWINPENGVSVWAADEGTYLVVTYNR